MIFILGGRNKGRFVKDILLIKSIIIIKFFLCGTSFPKAQQSNSKAKFTCYYALR